MRPPVIGLLRCHSVSLCSPADFKGIGRVRWGRASNVRGVSGFVRKLKIMATFSKDCFGS